MKMIHVYQLCSKILSFRQHLSAVKGEEIRTAKFCNEVFVMPEHLMTKLNIPESSSYIFPLHAVVLSQQYCSDMVKNSSFCTITCNKAMYSVSMGNCKYLPTN